MLYRVWMARVSPLNANAVYETNSSHYQTLIKHSTVQTKASLKWRQSIDTNLNVRRTTSEVKLLLNFFNLWLCFGLTATWACIGFSTFNDLKMVSVDITQSRLNTRKDTSTDTKTHSSPHQWISLTQAIWKAYEVGDAMYWRVLYFCIVSLHLRLICIVLYCTVIVCIYVKGQIK